MLASENENRHNHYMENSFSKGNKMQTFSNVCPFTGKTAEQLVKSNAEEKARLEKANYTPSFRIIERKTK